MKEKGCLGLLRSVAPIICIWLALFCCAGKAQGKDKKPVSFLGAGLGYGIVEDPMPYGPDRESFGINANLRFGFVLTKELLLMFEYEVHHIKDVKSAPEPMKASYILASVQIYLYKGFYIRPSVGILTHELRLPYATIKESGLGVYGVSAGYEYRFTQRFGLMLETVARKSGLIELLEERRTGKWNVLGIRVTGTWYF